MKIHRWDDIKKGKMSPERIAKIERAVARDLLEMDLGEIRQTLGKTQEEVAAAMKSTQSEVSRLEKREDHRLSTLRRVVEALGGELEVIANFGDRRVRLRAAG